MNIKMVPLKAIKPYWRNPRDNEDAVLPVMESIKRFGYVQPITLDKENVIITGHTRYKALLQLEVEEVPCIELDLPPEKAKEYRIIDNKTSEFARWNDDFIPELREFADLPSCKVFFPNISIDGILNDSMGMKYDEITTGDVQSALHNREGQFKDDDVVLGDKLEVICPECGMEFFILRKDLLRRP